MKRVRYLAGAAALAPAAIAMALPATANAGSAAGTAAGAASNAKTVSLHYTHAVMATGCTASAEFQLSTPAGNGHKRGHGYVKYTDNFQKFCIGTVVVSLEFTKTLCKNASLTLSGRNHSGSERTHQICGHPATNGNGKWFNTSFAVHKSFVEPGYVCVSSTYGSQKCDPFRDF